MRAFTADVSISSQVGKTCSDKSGTSQVGNACIKDSDIKAFTVEVSASSQVGSTSINNESEIRAFTVVRVHDVQQLHRQVQIKLDGSSPRLAVARWVPERASGLVNWTAGIGFVTRSPDRT